MRGEAVRLAAVMLVLLVLFAVLHWGNAGPQEDGSIIDTGPREPEEIYIYIRSAKSQRKTDGNYLTEVEFTTDIPGELTGMRMVTVFCGKQKTAFSLTEDNLGNVHKVCIPARVPPEMVRVEVWAHQTEKGLLLISDGEGQLCGCAEAPVDGDRILHLSGAKPGASYHLYRIADLSELLSGRVTLSSQPTVKERVAYALPDRYAATITAEADGTLFFNFTREGLPDGIYLALGDGEAFYLCVPQVEASGEFVSSVVRLSVGEEQRDAAKCTKSGGN